MKARIFIAAALALALLPTKSFAQMDERQPGIYTVVGQESRPLSYVYQLSASGSVGIMGVNVGHDTYKYKGTTSGVIASDTLVLVIDPSKNKGVITPKKFDIFVKSMTPDNIMILPLTVNEKKQRREYDAGTTIGIANASIKTKSLQRIQFEWEQISDNSFMIKVADLTPGEYGVIFRMSKLGQFDFNALLGFTIPEKAVEEPLQQEATQEQPQQQEPQQPAVSE